LKSEVVNLSAAGREENPGCIADSVAPDANQMLADPAFKKGLPDIS
jgi:hypothetical protein